MSYSSSRSGFPVGGLIAFVLLSVPVVFLGWLWGWNVYIVRALFVEGQFFGLLLAAVAVILVLIGVAVARGSTGAGVLATLMVIGLVVGLIFSGVNSIHRTQLNYLSDVEVTEVNTVGSYEQRVPYEIASNQADKNMGNSTGTAGPMKSIATEGEFGLWNSLVTRRGFGAGYESIVSVDSPTYGNVADENVERCSFDRDAAGLRLGGVLPHNDLARAVMNEVYWSKVIFKNDDAYGYCDGTTPMVVMPLVEVQGFIFYKSAPWGVATYNGETGELKIIQDEDEIREIPGPTYPISLAASQRGALHSYDGDFWQHGQGLLGWDTVGNTEVQLRKTETDESQYVTALQPRGASSNVVAVATVEANGFTPGKLNTLTVRTLEVDRAANATIRDTISNEYSYMPEFSGNKYEIYEIVPGQDGGWVASVGTDQSVVYRVEIDASGSNLKLIDRNGNEVAGRGGATLTPDPETGEVPATDYSNLEALNEQELSQLLREVADRLDQLSAIPVE